MRTELQLRSGVVTDELEAHARMTTERARCRRREHVRDATADAKQRAIGEHETNFAFFANRQERFSADEQSTNRKIFGLSFDNARRPVELDSTPTDESLIPTAARICHRKKCTE